MSQKLLKIGTTFCANGLPAGCIVSIVGESRSGKTPAVLKTIAECQQQGGVAAYIDTQHIFDPHFARRIGVNTEDLLVSQPDNAEQTFDIISSLVKTAVVDVIVVESANAMSTQAQNENPSDLGFAPLASLFAQAMPIINSEMRHKNTIIVFTSTLRANPYGGIPSGEGPRRLRESSPIILEMQRGEDIKKGGAIVGFRGGFVVRKNIIGAELTEGEFQLDFSKYAESRS